jgi:hypothetical protein
VKLFFVVIDDRRIDRTGFLTFPLLLGTLGTDVLHGLWNGKQVTIDADPREFPADDSEMSHAAGHLAGPTSCAPVPTGFDERHTRWIGHLFDSPTFSFSLLVQGLISSSCYFLSPQNCACERGPHYPHSHLHTMKDTGGVLEKHDSYPLWKSGFMEAGLADPLSRRAVLILILT